MSDLREMYPGRWVYHLHPLQSQASIVTTLSGMMFTMLLVTIVATCCQNMRPTMVLMTCHTANLVTTVCLNIAKTVVKPTGKKMSQLLTGRLSVNTA